MGLLIHEVSNPFFSEIASGVLEAAERHDRMVMICNTRRDPDQELRYIREMRALRVHAILVAGSEFADEHYGELLERELAEYRSAGGRVTLLRPHPAGSVVIPDTAAGGRLVAEHLMALGHRNIGVISGPPQLATIGERLSAFEKRLAADGFGPTYIAPGHFTRDGGREASLEMLKAESGITAIFALNDLMAVGAIHAAHQLGLRVPEDISIVGFNDIPIASDTSPQLTTIRLPLREWGEKSLEAALDGDTEQKTVILDVELIHRASSGPARHD